MRPIATHIETLLLRAVAAAAGIASTDRQKTVMIVEELLSRDWASLTFVGALHEMRLRLEGPAAETRAAAATLAATIGERDIALPGHFVAEIEVTAGTADVMAEDMIAISLTVNTLVLRD